MTQHRHPEAFLLLRYVTTDGEAEVLWNSRDGMAPTQIDSRTSGEPALLEPLESAVYASRYTPAVGERVIVDMTEIRARAEVATAFEEIERGETPKLRLAREHMYSAYPSREAALDDMASKFFGDGGRPDVLVVTAGWLEQLADSRRRVITGFDVAAPGWQPHDVSEAVPLEAVPVPEPSLYFDRQAQPISMERYCVLHADPRYLIVARHTIGPYRVSTVWLGVDHGWHDPRPVIFETMVFDERITSGHDEISELTERWYTEDEALRGHARIAAAVGRLLLMKSGN